MTDDAPGTLRRDLHELNRLSWNEATKAHNSHKGDQAAFFRAGGNKLYREEMELLGDIRGKRLVHLQCNAGQDTLSLVQLGAIATGVDISDEAIDFARKLSADSGVPAEFVRSDVYEWLEQEALAGPRWDIVFSSYGALCWLSDLDTWARGVAAILVPGGRFVVVDFHPMLGMLETDWSFRYGYFQDEPMRWDDGIGDYVALTGEAAAPSGYEEGVVDFKNPHPVWEFQWPTSRIIEALITAGLTIETFREYPYANGWKGFEDMREGPERRMYPPERVPSLPMMYAIAAARRS